MAELLKAITLIGDYCKNFQGSCRECPISTFCGKLPSEW